MEIVPLENGPIEAAADMFVDKLRGLRKSAPALPETMLAPQRAAALLEKRARAGAGLAAIEDGRLVGYLSWFVVERFRDTDRSGAYCPEWAHGARTQGAARIYRGLYRAAAERWQAAGCGVHVLTLLAHEEAAREVWFWNGFGLSVVDAIRWTEPLVADTPRGLSLIKARPGDERTLAEIEAEHWRHYAAPPVQMSAGAPNTEEEFAALLADKNFHAWLALEGGTAAAYLRLESRSHGAANIVAAGDAIAITGAFTRPAYRGRKLAPALLAAAIDDARAAGFRRMSVDFESFNPEAAAFWPRYFTPVCFSVMRIPERA